MKNKKAQWSLRSKIFLSVGVIAFAGAKFKEVADGSYLVKRENSYKYEYYNGVLDAAANSFNYNAKSSAAIFRNNLDSDARNYYKKNFAELVVKSKFWNDVKTFIKSSSSPVYKNIPNNNSEAEGVENIDYRNLTFGLPEDMVYESFFNKAKNIIDNVLTSDEEKRLEGLLGEYKVVASDNSFLSTFIKSGLHMIDVFNIPDYNFKEFHFLKSGEVHVPNKEDKFNRLIVVKEDASKEVSYPVLDVESDTLFVSLGSLGFSGSLSELAGAEEQIKFLESINEVICDSEGAFYELGASPKPKRSRSSLNNQSSVPSNGFN